MVSTSLLKLLRYSLYLAAIVLAAIELIVDAVAIAGINNFYVGPFYYYSFSPWRGAASYTMFVTLATLITIPIIAFGNLLASRGFAFATKSNYIISEVANSVLFTVLWFIAGVVMANYAGDGGCGGLSMCQKFKAATAFAWFPFFVFLCNSVVLVMLLLRVRKNGAPMTTLAYEVDFESGNAPAPGAPQHVDAPYAQQGKNDASYYGSSPQVAMPAPTH